MPQVAQLAAEHVLQEEAPLAEESESVLSLEGQAKVENMRLASV
ncbi:MAG: hypothetical protein U9Q17_02920 [Chloroflexota bacterium]|nr:hypothetical protein [Chloroflexota bacterium]